MKRLFILLVLGLLAMATFAESVQICLLRYPVQSGNTSHTHFPHAPLAPLYVEQDGYVLNIPQGGELSKVVLLQKGGVIYESEIQGTSVIEIPSCFHGDFELQLRIDDIEYIGNIYF